MVFDASTNLHLNRKFQKRWGRHVSCKCQGNIVSLEMNVGTEGQLSAVALFTLQDYSCIIRLEWHMFTLCMWAVHTSAPTIASAITGPGLSVLPHPVHLAISSHDIVLPLTQYCVCCRSQWPSERGPPLYLGEQLTPDGPES